MCVCETDLHSEWTLASKKCLLKIEMNESVSKRKNKWVWTEVQGSARSLRSVQ